MIEALSHPFMQRALLSGVLVGIMTSLLGVLVVLRRSAFFGDAIAHASLAGVALGLLLGWHPLLTAAGVGVGISASLHAIERHTRLALDTLLGFVLPFFMAIGVILLSLLPGYQPELVSFLFGSILTVSRTTLALVAAIFVVVLGFLARFYRQLVFATFDEDAAQLSGVHVAAMLTGYHILLALVVIASIRTVGVILVNALLIIPAATAKLLARSLTHLFVLTPLLGTVSIVGGMVASYYLNWPSGPTIVVLSGLLFLAVGAWRWLCRG
ncbi:MAG: membrane protein [Candidatus Tectimicrobiota bacterium]|nr:MAG: membrane protein [Candidatus Tectomicrobia bacterium]